MYAIIVYDVGEERVSRVCKYLRRFLNWVQNSAFEGELSAGQMERIKAGLGDIIETEEDSIYFYVARDKKWLKKEVLGQDKNLMDSIL
ncbi:MAG: CRISPR-associated endonuclease Cas2 [Dehalococcoidia bacterium]|nr:CRISPR-associated endonuclease Cas2 [Dehalococcoidia bacterium]